MKNEALTKRHKEILRFILIARLFDFQLPTFKHDLKGTFRYRINNFEANLNQIITLLKKGLPPEYEELLDNNAAGAWEVLEEFENAKDKALFLTVCKCFNQGLIQDSDNGLPINEEEFKDVLKTKSKAA
jgi:hypothetical protein